MKVSPKLLLGGILTFISRLRLLPANFSPLGSFGFFGQSPLIYFASILFFDKFYGGFYPGFIWTYLGFAAYPFLGFLTRNNTKLQILFLPFSSFSFFILSNLGSFFSIYPQNFDGLLTCYTLALPFYIRTLISDVIFGYGYLIWRERSKLLSCIALIDSTRVVANSKSSKI